MYYPYFRGKQFELLALRECAEVLAESSFVPIIEPVRESLTSLQRALAAMVEVGGQAIVIVNPRHGDHKINGDSITSLLKENYRGNNQISAGLLLRSTTQTCEAISLFQAHAAHTPAIIHAGFSDPKGIESALATEMESITNIFIEDQANMLYRRHFARSTRILVSDGFEPKKNADYDEVDPFSVLHVTYGDLGMQGFGDFLTVGDQYSEGGGPAYAVAIHLTYIDPAQDDAMFVYHFKSDTNDTPTDPAGKFAQALEKLMKKLDSGRSHLIETDAIQEFRRLHAEAHFPGLGYIKKLSIRHHIETLASYQRNSNA